MVLSPRDRARVVLLLITLSWGGAFSAIKYALTELPPGALTLLRFAFGSLTFVVALAVLRVRRTRYTRRDWGIMAFMAATGVAAYHWALNWGELFITPATGALLVATNPLITYLIATTMGTERRSGRRLAGVAVAFTGAIVVIRFADASAGFGVDHLVGAAVAMIAPVSWSLYTVVGKGVSRRHDPVATMAIITFMGTLMLLPAGLIDPVQGGPTTISPNVWLAVAYLGVLSSGLAYLGWMYCLRVMEPTEVSSAIYLVPCFAVVIDLVVLGTRPEPLFYAGAALVLAGLWVALGRRRPSGAPPTVK